MPLKIRNAVLSLRRAKTGGRNPYQGLKCLRMAMLQRQYLSSNICMPPLGLPISHYDCYRNAGSFDAATFLGISWILFFFFCDYCNFLASIKKMYVARACSYSFWLKIWRFFWFFSCRCTEKKGTFSCISGYGCPWVAEWVRWMLKCWRDNELTVPYFRFWSFLLYILYIVSKSDM